MIGKVIKHEWRNLTADRTAWIVLLLFAIVVGYATYKGSTWVSHLQNSIEQARQEERERLSELKSKAGEEENKMASEGKAITYPDWGPRHPYYVAMYRGQRYAAMPPAPLAQLAVGQTDLCPNYFKVSAGAKESFMIAQETESPFKLLAGQFDIAFVILYLYPLLILALSFNLVASEKEDGTLAMLLSNKINLRSIVAGKVWSRALIIFIPATIFPVISYFLGGGNLSGESAVLRLLLWILAVSAYGAFWFSVAIVVNAFGKGAATNAIILAAIWLAFVVVIPSVVNLASATLYPVPSRVEFVNASRAETQQAMEKGSQLLGKFYEDHPELARDNTKPDEADFAILRLVRDEEVARKLKPILDEFDNKIASQHNFVSRFRFLSPAILMQGALYDIAGSGIDRYKHFLTQVDEYHQEWKGFFAPRIFQKVALSVSDFDRLPDFAYREQSIGEVARQAVIPSILLLAAALILGYLGLRRYSHFPVVG